MRKNSKNKALITKVLFASAQSKKLEFENVKDEKWEEVDDMDIEIVEQEGSHDNRNRLMIDLLSILSEKQEKKIFSCDCSVEVLNKWWKQSPSLDQNIDQIMKYIYLVDMDEVEYEQDDEILSCQTKVINYKGSTKTMAISVVQSQGFIQHMKIRFF